MHLEAHQKLENTTQASTVYGDISKPKDINDIFKTVIDQYGQLNGLVNNAAILDQGDAGLMQTSIESFQNTLNTNLVGTFLMCKEALPYLQNNPSGAIVNLSSIVAHCGSANAQIAYTSSKGAIEAMTREIAIEFAKKNIRANCVASGPVKTKRNQHFFQEDSEWKKRRKYIPMGRLGTTDEIASLICFLLSDDASYITGASYLIDGGITNAYISEFNNIN